MKPQLIAACLATVSAACSANIQESTVKVDTSGCSQLSGKEGSTVTVKQRLLEVRSAMPYSDTCWNIGTAGYSIRYSWTQESAEPSLRSVQFWTLSNGREATVPASVSCREVHVLRPGADTSGRRSFRCSAEASVTLGYRGAYAVEIAPVADGEWDTAGLGSNYRFSL